MTTTATWTAPVRYAEADQQGVVFNAHYLLWCDEAMGTFCAGLGLHEFVELIRLKTSTLTWHAPARWGDVVEVRAACDRVGRTSFTMRFDVRTTERECCTVETVYVLADVDGAPQPISDADRATLTGA